MPEMCQSIQNKVRPEAARSDTLTATVSDPRPNMPLAYDIFFLIRIFQTA